MSTSEQFISKILKLNVHIRLSISKTFRKLDVHIRPVYIQNIQEVFAAAEA